jgi:hypothetical protein
MSEPLIKQLKRMKTAADGTVYDDANTHVQAIDNNLVDIAKQNNDIKNISNYANINYRCIAISLTDANNTDTWYDTNFPKIKNLGATLEVVPYCYVTGNTDSNVTNDTNIADKITRLLSKCAQYSVKISMIKPHIITSAQMDAYPRMSYIPSPIATFFTNWDNILKYFADICVVNNIPLLCISCEMSQVTDTVNYNQWQTLVDDVKSSYSTLKIIGALKVKEEALRDVKYQKNLQSNFCSLLDYVGLNSYSTMYRVNPTYGYSINLDTDGSNISTMQIIIDLYLLLNKKIIITETGCSNITDNTKSYISPLNFIGTQDGIDQGLWTNNNLNIFFKCDYIIGVCIWHYDVPFTFIGYNAENIIKTYFELGGI